MLVALVVAMGACASKPSAAAASPWALIVEVPRARFSLDTTRIGAQPNFVSVWIRVDWAEPQPLGDGQYQTTTIQQDIRCAARASRSRQMNAYMPGEDSTQYHVFPDTAWKGFAQQPLDEVYSHGACLMLSRLGKLPPA